MSRQLKIGADTSEIKKSITELSRMVGKDLGKSKIELFAPETKKLLRGEALTQAAALKRQIDQIKDSTKRHAQAIQDVVRGSKEELKIKKEILREAQHILKLEKDLGRINDLGDELKGGKGGFRGGLAKALAKIPGIGKLSAAGGMGLMGGAGLLGGGALLAGGAYGISRLMSARETYSGGIDARMRLRGRGVNDMNSANSADMESAGLNSLSLRSARLRDMDVFGRAGATQQSVIGRAKFERNYGVEEGTLSGIAGNFRSSMGGKGANQTLMKLQASLIASGITDAIGPYLETAAQMLTDINEKGFTMDESVTSLFNSMLKLGMGEGRTQKLMTGADAGIRGASGEANAFFQNIFGKAGIGGGTIGGSQAAMRMGGLFGVDLDKYKAMGGTDRKTFETLGIGGADHMQNVAGATISQLDKMFGNDKDIDKQLNSKDESTRKGGAMKRVSRLNYVMRAYGLKDEGQAAEVEGLLKQAKTSTPEQRKAIMRKVQDIKENTPELENLKRINASNEGIFDILKNKKIRIEDEMGEATAGLYNKTNELLQSIDGAILAIAKFVTGYETPQERADALLKEQSGQSDLAKSTSKKVLEGGMPTALNSTEMDAIKNGMTFEEGMEFTKNLKKKADAEKERGFSGNTAYETLYNSDAVKGYRSGIEGADRRRLREAGQPNSSQVQSTTPVYQKPAGGLDPEIFKLQILEQKRTNRYMEITAKNSKERGTLKPGTGSTTGQ
jgi:hypothetical protein